MNKYLALSGLTLALALTSLPGAAQAQPDPQMKAVLDQLARLGAKPLEKLTPDEARLQPTPADAVKALLRSRGRSTAPEAVANVEDRMIPGPAGQIAIRIYTPAGSGPFPVIHYIHGGGWVIADLDVYDASPRALANAAKAVVISSHYRQGPEHKFPAAHEDSFAAYRWVVANAGSINGDPARIAVAGESAGGNLAAAITMMARERGAPMPVHQLLIYPVADYSFATDSYQENQTAKPLGKLAMMWFFHHHLARPSDGLNPMLSIVRAENLAGLPSATIITAEIDPLRSEGKEYADRLSAAGVTVDYVNYDGVAHEFFGMGAVIDKAKQAVARAGTNLQRAFGQ